METASTLSAGLFCGLVLVVAIVLGFGLRRAGVGPVQTALMALVYLAIPGLLAWRGALDRYNPLPAPALVLLLALSFLTFSMVFFSPVGARLAAGLGLGAVVALQAFRIPVELMLHRLYVEGGVPIQMTYSGRNFDIISGVSGLILGGWLLSGRTVPRAVVLMWNTLGLVLLANIVIVAILSTPAPFRRFLEEPANLVPSTFPYVWLPSFLVQLALGSHLLVFRQLGRPR